MVVCICSKSCTVACRMQTILIKRVLRTVGKGQESGCYTTKKRIAGDEYYTVNCVVDTFLAPSSSPSSSISRYKRRHAQCAWDVWLARKGGRYPKLEFPRISQIVILLRNLPVSTTVRAVLRDARIQHNSPHGAGPSGTTTRENTTRKYRTDKLFRKRLQNFFIHTYPRALPRGIDQISENSSYFSSTSYLLMTTP